MDITFYKYQGTGNDFIIIDNQENNFKPNKDIIRKLCNRRFGIGADGLILLNTAEETDFLMVYFNSDGNKSTLCGNGGRCIVKFAYDMGIASKEVIFEAVDGKHKAMIIKDKVSLKMKDVTLIEEYPDHYFIDTGSPHHIAFVSELETYDVFHYGKKIRFGAPYFEKGTNVNFVEKIANNTLFVRTYERGVEDETYSCGTGATAVAIAAYKKGWVSHHVQIKTLGGNLEVQFKEIAGKFVNIMLTGPAQFVFKTTINFNTLCKSAF